MINFYTAFTREIDDPELAVQEILEQLNLKENKLKNTIGIVHFHCEFAENGIYQAIVDALPFDIAGCISAYIGIGGQYGNDILSVTMITGDDVNFNVQTVNDIGAKSREQITDEIKQICTAFGAEEKPKVVIPFMTQVPHFNGDGLVAAVNEMPDPLPMFGTIAFNLDDITNKTHFVLRNGGMSSDMCVFIAIYGNFEPKFRIVSSFSFDESFSDIAEITKADGPILKTVNGIPALEYFKKQGMITSDNIVGDTGIWIIPAILTYPNGTQVVRTFPSVVEGTEYMYSTGNLETGAKIMFSSLNAEKTVASAEKLFKEISEAKENNIIAFSCAARAWALGSKYFAEAQKIAECANEYQQRHNTPLNYCLSYSGGEICPVIDNDGKLVNVLHNYTLVSCAFG
jgi:hypothetical protein